MKSLEDYEIWDVEGKIDLEKTKALLEEEPELATMKDEHGNTHIHWMIAHNHWEALGVFIEKGADVNAQDNSGWTPLHHAVEKSSTELIDYFIAQGADLSIKDRGGFSPLNYAVNQAKDEVAEFIRNRGAKEE